MLQTAGEEKLNSVATLKDFWLFAVNQGWRHREAREAIAKATFLAVEGAWTSP